MTASRPLLVALSGGVDSAVTAGLLAEQGRSLVGVFMRNGISGGEAAGSRSCCSVSDARDARRVADHLGIPFYVQDLSRPFAELIQDFSRDYVAGRTPNPCVICNNDLKFGELLTLAHDLGCDGVATGHYARLEPGSDGAPVLRRGLDRGKDQSYLLHGLRREQLAQAHLPLGALSKDEVRAQAHRLGLAVADKPDSADICFVPGGDYRAVVRERLGHLGTEGEIVDREGRAVATHQGVGSFTVGQRRGLGVTFGEPAYVTDIDPQSGRVSVGRREDLARASCQLGPMNWLVDERPGSGLQDGQTLRAQLRHHHDPEEVRVELVGDERVRLEFVRPSMDVSPGQYAVLYRDDRVLGGGRILEAEPVRSDAADQESEA